MNPDGSLLPEVLAARALFWLLLPLVLWGPLRWSVFAWLVMSNLDTTGAGQSVIESAGWMNATKSLVLPSYLFWRLRRVPGQLLTYIPIRLWVVLTIYAGVAILWAPWPLAAAKLVGNMVGILIALVTLEKAARAGLLNTRLLLWLLAISLGLAALQTYYYAGSSYGFDGFDQPLRLTSFIGAQQFGGFLVAFFTLVVWRSDFALWSRVVCGAAVLAALALNGSRVWFLGAAVIAFGYLCLEFRRSAVVVTLTASFAASAFLLFQSFSPYADEDPEGAPNRIAATWRAVTTGIDTANRVGTRDLTFRTAIYNGILSDISASTVSELALGHGTSSGAQSVLRVFPASYSTDHMDPNRIVHNEWLRALYEWGLVGLCLLISIFFTLVAGLISLRRYPSFKSRASAAISFVGAFLIAFTGENVLAGAGNAVTISLALILALIWAPPERTSTVNV
jgi:hypothetical protein